MVLSNEVSRLSNLPPFWNAPQDKEGNWYSADKKDDLPDNFKERVSLPECGGRLPNLFLP